MKFIIFITCLLSSPLSFADSHAVQVLAPFMGDEQEKEYLKTFDEPISVVIDSTTLGPDSGLTGEMYIYIYRINQYAIRSFTIVNCSPEDKNKYAFNMIPKPKKNWKQTKLNQRKKQVAIYYSQEPPTEIKYYFNKEKDKLKTIMGPRCLTKPKPFYEKELYQGPKIKDQPWYVNSLLRYRVFNVDKKTNELTIHIYYSSDASSETFTVTPTWMGKYFNPNENTNEIVTIPLTEIPNKMLFSVYTNRATEYKLKYHPHDKYRDTDVFYFKKAKKVSPTPLMKRQINYNLVPITGSKN